MLKNIFENLKKDGPELRGAPFWAWNSKLSKDELIRQINVLHEMGMGGFFMHSRVGLNTEFLSDEWFDLVEKCIDEAEKLGMKAYLYDEDRWPSGTAGGMVTKDKKYRIQSIAMTTEPVTDDPEAIYSGSFGVDKCDENGLPMEWHKCQLDTPGKVLHFYTRPSREDSWYNGQTYVNTLDPDAIKRFIDIAYSGYVKRFKDKFGTSVGAIFSDEPNYCSCTFSENANTLPRQGVPKTEPPKLLPWTREIPELFRNKYGYDLMEKLPELFYDNKGEIFSKVRMDFFSLVTELFVNSYSRQIGEYCRNHNLPFTGHMHWEDALTLQRHQVGAAMRSYEYMDIPGIDLLTEHWQIYDTVKQCVSVAAQLGRKWRLSECYGCTGWDFPFAGHKAIGEWQYALGINFRCQHLAWYSMDGEAKRDYPASISFQSPWYKKYPVIERHFSRLAAVLTEGRERRNILVLHPIESTWGWKSDAAATEEEAFEHNIALIDLRNTLLHNTLDFDYGDEEIMSRHAQVRGNIFTVGQADYKAIVIPQLLTIRRSTLELLERFSSNGGLVLYKGKAPEYVDGLKSDDAGKVFSGFINFDLDSLAQKLAPVRLLSVTSEGREIEPVLSMIREGNDFSSLFLCNVGHKFISNQKIEAGVLERKAEYANVTVRWQTSGRGSIVEYSPDNNEFYAVDSHYTDGWRCFETSFEKLGSRLFIETEKEIPLSKRPNAAKGNCIQQPAQKKFKYTCHGPNTLVLDQMEYKIGTGNFSQTEYFIDADAAIRDYLGIPRRGGAMAQPYARKKTAPAIKQPVTLKCRFNAEYTDVQLFLASEHPELYTFELNGKTFDFTPEGYWTDPVLQKSILPRDLLKKGENTLVLQTEYNEYHPGIESLFILGDFAVKDDCIVQMPPMLELGNWCEQGFPYYAENLSYQMDLQLEKLPENPLFLRINDWRGTLLGISVNNSDEKLLPWPPYILEITDLLKPGSNQITITVYGHRRNAFGPFYLNEPSPAWHGPLQMKTKQQPEKQLMPVGLFNCDIIS